MAAPPPPTRAHRPRRPARPRSRRAALAFLAAACLGLAACALLGEEEAPGDGEEGEAAPAWTTVPAGRSRHPVGGSLSYHLASVTRRGDGVVVDLDLHNGTSRFYRTTAVEITVLGEEGRSRTRWLPIGRLGSQRKRRVVARIPDVPFEVEDVLVEVFAR